MLVEGPSGVGRAGAALVDQARLVEVGELLRRLVLQLVAAVREDQVPVDQVVFQVATTNVAGRVHLGM